MANYLDFELKIKEIEDQINEARLKGDFHAVKILEKELDKVVKKIYKNLTEYQKLQLARHPDRPYSLDYIRGLLSNSFELHGDRSFRDDPAIVCYFGEIEGKKVLIIGEEKGRGTKNKLKRNFGTQTRQCFHGHDAREFF